MDWPQNRGIKQTLSPTVQEGHGLTLDPITNELFLSLKQGYEERLIALETQIRETYIVIENDEILNTMKLSEVSNEFRRQRVQEIVEESLSNEKEVQIDRLIQANAILKSELLKYEDENLKVKKIYQEEVEKFQKTMSEFEDLIQRESHAKHKLQDENERLTLQIDGVARKTEELGHSKDRQTSLNAQGYQNENFELKKEIDNLKMKVGQGEYLCLQKEEIINDLKKDLEVMTEEYAKLEGSYNGLVEEYNTIKDSLDKIQEKGSRSEEDYESLKQRLYSTENELKKANNALQNALGEKNQLLTKSEYIAAQARQIVEKEQKTITETLDSLKRKYKAKKALNQKKIEELAEENQKLRHDNEILKVEINESKTMNDRMTSQMESNMKMIKSEWEKKCQEIELSSQKAMSELTTKYQIEITQLQTEYQSVLDRKLSELHNEASTQISKSKNADIETKAQLESRVAQIEKDYISKTKHENILTNEILDLRANHARELRELEERIESEYSQRTRELVAKAKSEFDNDLQEVKEEKKHLEHQIIHLENDNQKCKEIVGKEREKIEKLKAKLQESEKKQKDLKAKLEELNSYHSKLKRMYEDELKKINKLEQEKSGIIGKIQGFEKKENGFEQLVSMLRNEISTLNDLNTSYKSEISDIDGQRESLEEEIAAYKSAVENLKKEKTTLEENIRNLSQEIQKGSQKHSETVVQVRKEEEARVEQEQKQKLELQAKLHELEPKHKTLENKLKEKEEEIDVLKGIIEKLERYNTEIKTKNQGFEDDLRAHKNEIRELQKRLERNRYKFGEKLSKIWRLFVFKAENLRNEVAAIRTKCITELESNRHAIIEMVKDLTEHFQQASNLEKIKALDEKKKEIMQIKEDYEDELEKQTLTHLQEIQKEKNDYEKLAEKYVKENENLRNEVDGVKSELQEVLIKIDRTNQSKLDFQKKLKAAEEENESLKRANSRKDEEAETAQLQLRGELKKLKEELSRIGNDVMREARLKNRQEVNMILQMVDDLKFSNMKRLKQVEGEMMNYQVMHERDLVEVIEKYEKEASALKEELVKAKEDVNRKEREKLEIKKNFDVLEERYNELHEENQSEFTKYEEKLAEFKEMIMRDSSKYLEKKDQANAEIDNLRLQVRDLIKDLKIKDKELDEMNLRVQDQKEELIKLKAISEIRTKRFEKNYTEPERPQQFLETKVDENDALSTRPMRDRNPFNNIVDTSTRRSGPVNDNQRLPTDTRLSTWSRYGGK